MYIEIKSSDKYGEIQNKRHKCTKDNDRGQIKYFYNDENGDNQLILSENRVELRRKSEFESRLVLEKGVETIFCYKSEYLDSEFKVFTEKLDIFEKRAALKYSLSDIGGLINIIEMEIIEVE
jgi:hypothetical protein